jgi:NtrC-family two-component system sensor histidine kinase KinB
MKSSIRTKFTLGMIFLFIIILVLSIFSGFYMNKLSKKTSAILKENYLSVVYAREMSESIMIISQEITNCYLTNKNPDSLKISTELNVFAKSLQSEKNNITEPGEAALVSGIETEFGEYRNGVKKSKSSLQSSGSVLNIQNIADHIYQQLVVLSEMNGNAILAKTDEAKVASKNALTRMTVLGTLCFLIALSFTFSFVSYFNERFFQLYNGIKEIASSNYDQRLFFEGKDEFYEISLVFNEMAEKLNNNKQKMSVTLQEDIGKEVNSADLQELKKALFRIKSMEEQIAVLISRVEKK